MPISTAESFMPSTPSRPTGSGGDRSDRPRQERAQITQAAIIRAAATVFAERGYARTTLDAVAVEAGVTKGALYFHFASKHALANAVITEETRVMQQGAERVLAGGTSALETLILLVDAFTTRLVSDVVVAAGIKLTTEELVAQLDIQVPYQVWGELYTELFGRAIAEGDVGSEFEPDMLSRHLVSLFTGVQLVSNSLTQRADLAERVAETWIVLLAGIVPPARLDAIRAFSPRDHRPPE
jgi:AcrR family transcriptional regulator